jgi:hypothetical protein
MPMMGLMICCIGKIVYKSNEFMVIGAEVGYHCHFMMIKSLHSMNVTAGYYKKMTAKKGLSLQ